MTIVFFDGFCILCNGFINFLIERDKKHVLNYSTLQGNTAKELFPELNTSQLQTVIYLRKGKVYYKSQAALLILKDLGLPWSLTFIFVIIPPLLRNWIYNLVAKNRLSWFGKRETCRLPTEHEKELFLD